MAKKIRLEKDGGYTLNYFELYGRHDRLSENYWERFVVVDDLVTDRLTKNEAYKGYGKYEEISEPYELWAYVEE